MKRVAFTVAGLALLCCFAIVISQAASWAFVSLAHRPLRWPTVSEWGVIALMFIVFFLVLFIVVPELLARRDVRKIRKQKADRSR